MVGKQIKTFKGSTKCVKFILPRNLSIVCPALPKMLQIRLKLKPLN